MIRRIRVFESVETLLWKWKKLRIENLESIKISIVENRFDSIMIIDFNSWHRSLFRWQERKKTNLKSIFFSHQNFMKKILIGKKIQSNSIGKLRIKKKLLSIERESIERVSDRKLDQNLVNYLWFLFWIPARSTLQKWADVFYLSKSTKIFQFLLLH